VRQHAGRDQTRARQLAVAYLRENAPKPISGWVRYAYAKIDNLDMDALKSTGPNSRDCQRIFRWFTLERPCIAAPVQHPEASAEPLRHAHPARTPRICLSEGGGVTARRSRMSSNRARGWWQLQGRANEADRKEQVSVVCLPCRVPLAGLWIW